MFLLICSIASAATITVGPTGDYRTLASGVSAASDGDRIELEAGDYKESVNLTKNLEIVGVSGAAATTVSGSGSNATFSASRVTVVLEGITVTSEGNHAIYASESDVTLRGVTVTGVDGDESGAGMVLLGGSLTAVNLDMYDCRSESNKGALLYANEARISVSSSTFSGGQAERGGAIFLSSSEASFLDVRFDNNVASPADSTARGGAMRVESSILTLTRTVLEDNLADSGFGGGISAYLSSVEIRDSEFLGNIAEDSYGGGIVVWDGAAILSDTLFQNNQATDLSGSGNSHGGAIYALGDHAMGLSLSSVDFVENSADGNGGAVRVSAGAFSASDGLIRGNSASSGGGFYISTEEDLLLDNLAFEDNSAGFGAGLRWKPEDDGASLILQNSSFQNNISSSYGGALYAYDAGSLQIEQCSFIDNSSTLGGALMVWAVDELEVSHSLFCENEAHSSKGDDADGGAAVVYQAAWLGHSWTNNRFTGNQSDTRGGALRFSVSGDAEVYNNHLLGNSADAGAALSTSNTDVDLSNNLIAWNTGDDALFSEGSPRLELVYTDLWANDDDYDDDFDRAIGDGMQFSDPELVSYTFDCSADRLTLRPNSPLRDSGDPSFSDPDGSRSDIGAYGGPEADAQAFTDADNDSWSALDDCDDNDATVHPEATEQPYDTLDQDCDGEDINDVDGDGALGGPDGSDCDDQNKDVFPGAEDAWYDGVDTNCDGADDFDQDGDGFSSQDFQGGDCDDLNAAVNPDADELDGDDLDSDCDGQLNKPVEVEDPDINTRPKRCSSASGPPSALWGLALLLALGRRRA